MSDRYLYKAKRTENGKWVEGFLLLSEDKAFICKRPCKCMEEYSSVDRTAYGFGGFYEADKSTICQCTGQPDKEGTLIFENDLVRASGGVHGVVRFGKYGDTELDYGFYIEWDRTQPHWRHELCFWQPEIRVIGSYVDNSELLEVDNE